MSEGEGHSVTLWVDLLKTGDTDAAQRIWARFSSEMLQHARRRLRDLPRSAQDEEDVALSAFHSFCQAVVNDRFPDLEDRDDVRTLLLMHTMRKALNVRRTELARKRGGAMTQQDLLDDIVSPELDPVLSNLMAEETLTLLDALDDENLRRVASDRLDGYENAEIARRLGCSVRTVERRLFLIRRIWSERLDARLD